MIDNQNNYLTDFEIKELIKKALTEDQYENDISSLGTIDKNLERTGSIFALSSGVVSGVQIAKMVFLTINPKIVFKIIKNDGDFINRGDAIASVEGNVIDILRGERVALNFLQKLSGIATNTNKCIQELQGLSCKIYDTRNTTPLLRTLEKKAVRDGGGYNHRFNLKDEIFISYNHIACCDNIKDSINKIRNQKNKDVLIKIEVENKSEFIEALNTDCDIILLNNIKEDEIKELVEINNHRKKIELSGNITLKKIRFFAKTGVDFIALNSLIDQATFLNIDFKFLKRRK